MYSQIEIIESKLYAAVVADEIIASVGDSISEKGKCSIVLAGGSTPGNVYRAMTKPPRVEEVDWGKVNFFLGDERWVPINDTQSNFKMIQETLLSGLPRNKTEVFHVDTSLSSPEESALAYAKLIREVEKLSPTCLPSFDIILLGIGEDGHMASLFPGSPPLKEEEPHLICTTVFHPQSNTHRITLTPKVLLACQKVFFLAKGGQKASVVQRALEGDEEIMELPARLFEIGKKPVTWFLDSEAAQELALKK